jgi:hypothetical protein
MFAARWPNTLQSYWLVQLRLQLFTATRDDAVTEQETGKDALL